MRSRIIEVNQAIERTDGKSNQISMADAAAASVPLESEAQPVERKKLSL